MILSDNELRRYIEDEFLVVPEAGPDGYLVDWMHENVQPASVEVHLFDEMIDPATEEYFVMDRTYSLYPGQFLLGSTVEFVNVPPELVGFVHGKSSLARKGLLVHVTAGLLDPGFRGMITLELKNVSNTPIRLVEGMKIGQLTFQTLTSEPWRTYGTPSLNSHYQNQHGPRMARD